MSIKVAKYAGTDRDVLTANNEYGFCSLLKATDHVLDKLKVENNVSSEITYKRRIDTPLWDERAMREIVVNAIVHNDYYTNEVPPKFEIFSDHIEITSAGRLPIDRSQKDNEIVPYDEIVGNVNNEVGSVNGSVNKTELTKRQLVIISIIANNIKDGCVFGSVNPNVTTKDIISKLNLSERTVYRELAVLKQMGFIKRIGSDKNGHWELS